MSLLQHAVFFFRHRITTSIIVSDLRWRHTVFVAPDVDLKIPLPVVTNHPEHDPDIQHIPFFAISPKFFGSLWSTYYKRVMEFDGFSRMMIGLQ